MSTLQLQLLRSPAEVSAHAAAWHDLYQHAWAEPPTASAEHLALWQRHFASVARLRVIVVHDQRQWLAAWPLVERRWQHLLPLGDLPGNAWTPGGKLLVRRQADAAAVAHRLVDGLGKLPWPLLELQGVNPLSPAWKPLLEALDDTACQWRYQPWFQVGCVDLADSWDTFLRGRSRNFRHDLKRKQSRAAADSLPRTSLIRPDSPQAAAEWVDRLFEVEQRSWKGTAGSAVLSDAHVHQFFREQAAQLAVEGQLLVGLWEHNDQLAAVQYGFLAHDTYWLLKIGYDPAYASLSPGHLLMADVLSQLHENRLARRVDFLGPLIPATERWSNAGYELGRLLIARPGWLGRLAYQGRTLAQRRPIPAAAPTASDAASSQEVIAASVFAPVRAPGAAAEGIPAAPDTAVTGT